MTITDRAPTEFRYWDRVDEPAVQRARKVWRRVWRFDPQPSADYVHRFSQAYYDTDPVAEAFVADVYDTLGAKVGRTMLDRAIEHGIDAVPDAPDSMRRLFDEFEMPPPWLDAELVERGARVFRRWGTAVFKFATASTLEMYAESSIAPPLDRLADRNQRRRRESWYRNQMGDRRADFMPAEQLRR
jgi:hypothetical protein